jgi:hypothetical protein
VALILCRSFGNTTEIGQALRDGIRVDEDEELVLDTMLRVRRGV